MGLFDGIRNTWKKSEAAVIVQNLLDDLVKMGMMDDGEKGKLANVMVGRVWDAKPDIFSGTFGQRPHKFCIAAVTFSYAIESFGIEHETTPAFAFALGRILEQIQLNGHFMGLNSSDTFLIEAATKVYTNFAETTSSLDFGGIV